MVDLSKIKPGDTVVVRLKARELGAGGIWLDSPFDKVSGKYGLLSYGCNVEIEHHPKALSVGDRATHRDYAASFEIIAIHGENAWACWSDGHLQTVPLAGMERAQ